MGSLKIVEAKIENPKIHDGMKAFRPIQMPVFTVGADGKVAGVFKPVEEPILKMNPDLRRNLGVQYSQLNLSATKKDASAHPTPFRAGAAVVIAGVIAAAFKYPEMVFGTTEVIKSLGRWFSLGLLPVLGMVNGGGKKTPTQPTPTDTGIESEESFTQFSDDTPRLNEDQMRRIVEEHSPDPNFHFPNPIRFSDREEYSRFYKGLSETSHPLATVMFEGDQKPFSMATMGEFYHQGEPVKVHVILYLEWEDSLRPQHYLIQIVTDRPIHETSFEGDENVFDTFIELHAFDHALAEKIHRQFVEVYVRTGSVEEAVKWLLSSGLN